jgi:hypothetical protein
MTELTIRQAYIRRYPDNGQRLAHIEWFDGSWTTGDPENGHMAALIARAHREGVTVRKLKGIGQ